MRVLQINNCHYRRGGADVVYLNTGELLESFGNEVYYFSQKNEKNISIENEKYFIEEIDFFNKSKIEKIISLPRFFYSKEASNKLEVLIKKVAPQIAHIHTYKGTLTPSILKKLKEYSIPVVITLHDYGLLCPHNSFLNGKGQICTKCLDTSNSLNGVINRCNRNSIVYSTISVLEYSVHKYLFPFEKYFNHLIAVSKFGFGMHLKKKEFQNKISHIYNFVNTKEIKPNFEKGNYFLYYGRLSEEKGILTLLKAWSKLNKNISLKIAGDGPLKETLLEFIEENSLRSVEYIGFKQKKELFDVISKCSFSIIPSECFENNPLAVIESYALGKPVIGANVGGIPEIIDNENTGYVFEMKNAIDLADKITKASLISDKEYLKVSKAARLFSEKNFSEKEHYSKLMSLYDNLVSKENDEV